MRIRQELLQLYSELCQLLDIHELEYNEGLYIAVKEILEKFTSACSNPAIWCFGEHTHMLMTDFVYELKKVHYIIDDSVEFINEEGYVLISSDVIPNKEIDGIIVSSYKYSEEIANKISTEYPHIKCLNIYKELAQYGIHCTSEYYLYNHPYSKYRRINELHNEPKDSRKLIELIRELILIKDFWLAGEYAIQYSKMFSNERADRIQRIICNIQGLIKNSIEAANTSGVLLLCIDSLRKQDLDKGLMPNLQQFIDNETESFENAFSCSTSTYESLIPAYSENFDLTTEYYEKNLIEADGCRFVNEAIKQNKKIYFYTDAEIFIDNPNIIHVGNPQTASEKVWQFVLDSADGVDGLFYIHILYESHFSFVNPYTKDMFIGGTNMFFDLLDRNGGQLKAEYKEQHADALRYLDDLLEKTLLDLKIPMVIYADHGIEILEKNARIADVFPIMLGCTNSRIRIPFAFRSVETIPQKHNMLFSLGNINDVVISLINHENFCINPKSHIKIQRSALYNPDYRSLFQSVHFSTGCQAYEAFVFLNGVKIVIYEKGKTYMYNEVDEEIDDPQMKRYLVNEILSEVTVCTENRIWANL